MAAQATDGQIAESDWSGAHRHIPEICTACTIIMNLGIPVAFSRLHSAALFDLHEG